MTGSTSRGKGQSGELEVAAILPELTGLDVRRRVRQHDGDSDLEGLPDWAVEVKRHRTTPPDMLALWWRQAVLQATSASARPVLFYRADRAAWRCVWASGLHCWAVGPEYANTLDAVPSTWWAMVKPLRESGDKAT